MYSHEVLRHYPVHGRDMAVVAGLRSDKHRAAVSLCSQCKRVSGDCPIIQTLMATGQEFGFASIMAACQHYVAPDEAIGEIEV